MAIAVDLDGVLAEYHRFEGNHIIGAPITKMWLRVISWLEDGEEVWIFTARGGTKEERAFISKWLDYHGLPDLPITNIKLKDFQEIWDDRAVFVPRNSGEPAEYLE